ncbi:GNAT family N-acetyltransferase [Leclercia adecarboxylata]|jgi:GNAT superfamily N-acetyltransferase|uniref:N-acetyltransferase n=1 Tax=Leclercia adecarboxylata TaxID=83655 RepID=A0A855EFW2_9ENTR|nr:GNAT family N-acetyltransferase [Leclercia adecarboxylata]KFC90758.1 GCN5 family N-acetyltransferase [Leclercia adecarboxylata ATCC 23216 = NBRC 102595]MCE9980580.1 GNAT family N-acetyltransferase [Leclercia adecarboxylata]MCH2683208.1 GNAT family N-acetyltransferase [Leclercia adecarboxylata]PHH03408.1 N-acetyltransferase [Leclercia adecarboxylata]QBF88543.1 GNAT family N-acetyltransferase [Leclercia adecarboxylata]
MVKVREAKAEDYEAWLRLWNGYLSFYGTDLDEAVTLATWHRVLSADSSLFCRLAETEQGVVGFAICVLHEGTWVTQPLCYLEDLFVDDAARGKGAGRALIEAIINEAREKGWSKVYWVTREGNPARALYDKLAVVDDYVRYRITI